MKTSADIIDSIDALDSSATPTRTRDFYELTKPRMNFLVLITTMVGYFMAIGHAHANLGLLAATLVGTALCASSAAVLNQIVERRFDALMPRTRNRPIPTGRIGIAEAAWFGIGCGVVGVTMLAALVNGLTALLGLITIAWYLLLYTPAKRVTSLNTLIGAVPGAIPPIMGFTAAHGAFSGGAIAVFAILFFWQMPHFLAIAILYRDDYAAGGFKMLPCDDRELRLTGMMCILYAMALIPVSLLPALFGIAGAAYFTAAVLLGFAFLTFAVSLAVSRERLDARKLFFASIIYLPLLLGAMMLDRM